jgi:transitional endoplasmic reticulum ATPase
MVGKPDVRFDDIAGLEDAKREIRLRMILPVLFPEHARQYRIRRGGGLLLYGPPGTGKTMLAKAVAAEVDALFYHIRPSDVISGQVGEAEANIASLFRTLRWQKRAVLFIDEVESLVPSRRRNGSTIMQRVISQILGEVDGLAGWPEGHVLLLIGATNEPGLIDPAMMRPGRFDARVYVGPPNLEARKHILETSLRGRPFDGDVDLDRLASRTEGMSGADIKRLADCAADRAFERSISCTGSLPSIGLSDFVLPAADRDEAIIQRRATATRRSHREQAPVRAPMSCDQGECG